MSVELVLEDLKKRYGDRKVLYARDIAEIIGQSPARVQRLMRTRSLPFSSFNVGRQSGVSLYAVALWLAGGEPDGVVSDRIFQAFDGKDYVSPDVAKSAASAEAGNVGAGKDDRSSSASLVSQILAMRHDAARFIVCQVSMDQYLPRKEVHFWWSVVKHLMFDHVHSPGWVLRVVRIVTMAEQNIIHQFYDTNGLEHAIRDMAAYVSDDMTWAVHLTLKDAVVGKTVVEVMRQGQEKFVLIDRVGFSGYQKATSI